MILSDERIYNRNLSALMTVFVHPLRIQFEKQVGRGHKVAGRDQSRPGVLLMPVLMC